MSVNFLYKNKPNYENYKPKKISEQMKTEFRLNLAVFFYNVKKDINLINYTWKWVKTYKQETNKQKKYCGFKCKIHWKCMDKWN